MTGIDTTADPVPPRPGDRLSGYAWGWLAWVACFAALEGYALWQDRVHRGTPDEWVKRTLSANLRFVFATDSVTGVPLDVPFGKLRRLALVVALGPGWLPSHLGRRGVV